MDQFLLFCFKKNGELFVTRGRDMREAQSLFGGTFVLETPINAAFVYSTNHPYDWRRIPPLKHGKRNWVVPDLGFRDQFFH